VNAISISTGKVAVFLLGAAEGNYHQPDCRVEHIRSTHMATQRIVIGYWPSGRTNNDPLGCQADSYLPCRQAFK